MTAVRQTNVLCESGSIPFGEIMRSQVNAGPDPQPEADAPPAQRFQLRHP